MKCSHENTKEKLRCLASLKAPFRVLDINAFPETPQGAFLEWLDEAIAEGLNERHAMTLSTVDGNCGRIPAC
jgi:pyridoxamine 5'-phosphate oxidase